MGRGSSKAGGGSANSGGLYDGIHTEGKAADQKRADAIVKGTRDVLKDFGVEDELRSVYYSDRKNAHGMNAQGDLSISNKLLREPNESTNGYFVSVKPL